MKSPEPKHSGTAASRQGGMTAAIVRTFVESKLSLLFLVGSLLAGVAGLTLTPREEEPQIIVPMVDSVAEIRDAVQFAHYPPLGTRSHPDLKAC